MGARARRTLVIAMVVLSSAFAGCLGSTDDGGPREDRGNVTDGSGQNRTAPADLNASASRFGVTESPSNFEPTVAAGPDGTVYLTGGNAQFIHVTTDAGDTWDRRPAPPPADGGPRTLAGDALVRVDTSGRLWYIALKSSPTYLGPLAQGLQVAVSEDMGQTWSANHYIGGPEGPAQADRPWVAFGSNGTTYITWKTLDSQRLRAVQSSDGGQSLSGPVEVTPEVPPGGTLIGGRPSVASDGALVVPYLLFGEDNESIRTAQSMDGGQTFRQLTVWEPAGEVGSLFPVLAVDGQDRIHLVWKGPEAQTLHTVSSDGGTGWTDPAPVPELTGLGGAGPWIEVHDGIARVGALRPVGDGRLEVGLTAFPADTSPARNNVSVVAATAMLQLGGRPDYSDFAHLDRLPSGETLAVWAHAQTGQINVEKVSVS